MTAIIGVAMAHVMDAGRTTNRYQVTEVSAESKTKISAGDQRLTREEADAIQERTDRYGKATLPEEQADRLESGGVTVQPGESVTVDFERVEDPNAPMCYAEEYALMVLDEDGEVQGIVEDEDRDGSVTFNWADGNQNPVTVVPMVIGPEGLDGEIDISVESTHPVAEGQPIPEWDGDSWEVTGGTLNLDEGEMAELGLEEAAGESTIPFDRLLGVNAIPGEALPPEDLGESYQDYLSNYDDGEHYTEAEWARRTAGTDGSLGTGTIETAGGVEYRFTEDGQVEMYAPGQGDEAAALTWTQDGMVEERDGTDPYHGQVEIDGEAISPTFINVDESGALADYDADGNLTGFTVQNGDAIVHATYDAENGWTFDETRDGGGAWRGERLEDASNPVYTIGGSFDPENGGYGDILTYTGSNVANPTGVVTGTAGDASNEVSVPTDGSAVPFVRDTGVLPEAGTIAYEQALRQQIADIQAGAFAEQRDEVFAMYEAQLDRPLTEEEIEMAETMLRLSIDQSTANLSSTAEYLISQSQALREELEALHEIPGAEIAPFVPDQVAAPPVGVPSPTTGSPPFPVSSPTPVTSSGAPMPAAQGIEGLDAVFSDPAMFHQLLMSIFGAQNPSAGWGGIDGLMGNYASELGATYDWDRYMMMNDVVGALFALMGGYGSSFGNYDPMLAMMYSSNGTVRP